MTRIDILNASFSPYPIFNARSRSLKNAISGARVGGRRLAGRGDTEFVQALNNINLSVKAGDRIGLIGHNGAGKSTLRLIAGIAHPSTGLVKTEGRIIPLISRGLGINPELTGRQNIELPLRLFGASSSEVALAHETVPEFTELGEFMDLPVRTYSDGMRARLTFAICTALSGDILVLDEWLGAGDAGFVHKASERLKTMVDQAGIVVLASHSSSILHQNCNKLAWMRKGEIIAVGAPREISEAYAADMRRGADSVGPGAPLMLDQPARPISTIKCVWMEAAWYAQRFAEARRIAEELYAQENSGRASYRLGTIHYYGHGAPRDLSVALPYFRHNTLTEDPWAIYHQGLILADQTFPGRNDDLARNLMEIAMAKGVRESQPKSCSGWAAARRLASPEAWASGPGGPVKKASTRSRIASTSTVSAPSSILRIICGNPSSAGSTEISEDLTPSGVAVPVRENEATLASFPVPVKSSRSLWRWLSMSSSNGNTPSDVKSLPSIRLAVPAFTS
ncbi:MAG: ATP-binding cassette domain-containing protein [Hyphomonas sp.]